MLSLQTICFQQGQACFDGLTASFKPGSISVIIGPNGAGKSTLLDLVSGWLVPSDGNVLLDRDDVHQMNAKKRSASVAYLPTNNPVVFDILVRDLLHVSADQQRWFQILTSSLDLHHLLEKSYLSCSSGEQARIQFARVLLNEHSDILLLDEFSANMDVKYVQRCFELLSRVKQARHIIAVVHDINLAWQVADELFVLNNGQLEHCQTPEQLQVALFKAFDVRYDLVQSNVIFPRFRGVVA